MLFSTITRVACAAGISALAISSPAHALTFNWSFENNGGSPLTGGTTSGTITGLTEGINDLAGPGVSIEILASQNQITGVLSSLLALGNGGTITVLNGVIIDYNFLVTNTINSQLLSFYGIFNSGAAFGNLLTCDANIPCVNDTYLGPINIFSSGATPVPGPLPVLGASAAFVWSRRIRKRIAVATRSTDRCQG